MCVIGWLEEAAWCSLSGENTHREYIVDRGLMLNVVVCRPAILMRAAEERAREETEKVQGKDAAPKEADDVVGQEVFVKNKNIRGKCIEVEVKPANEKKNVKEKVVYTVKVRSYPVRSLQNGHSL